MNKEMEQKFFVLNAEIKAAPDSGEDSMTFSGYGAYFNNIDSYGDMIVPGAFKSTVASAKKGEFPAMLAQHGMDSYTPVGVFTKIEEDEKGLYVEGKLANTSMGRDLYELMKMEPRPAIKGMSIGFRTNKATYVSKENAHSFPKGCYRKLEDIEVLEISIVTFPANKKATITNVKGEFIIRDAEKALREAGYSANEAKTIISIIKNTSPADMEEDEQRKLGTEEIITPLEDKKQENPEVIEEKDEISEELKGLLEYFKDLHDPESSGLELSEEEKSELASWVEEQKKQNELIELRDFLAKS